MPLYEYRCEQCGEQFEVMQKFADEPLTTHDRCGGPVHRLISAPALQFKGSGWYITDYAKSGASGGEKNGSPAAKPDSGGEKKGSSDGSANTPAATTATSDTKSDKK